VRYRKLQLLHRSATLIFLNRRHWARIRDGPHTVGSSIRSAIRRPRDTPIRKLEGSFRCRSCGTRRYKPPVHVIKLTTEREIKHWDIDNGEAGAWLLFQKVGDFIQREADFLRPTDAERQSMDAAAKATSELNRLHDLDEPSAKALREIVRSGQAARRSFAARKAAHRKFGTISKNASRIKAMLECATPRLRKPLEDFNASALSVATLSHTLTFVQENDLECPDEHSSRQCCRIVARKGHRKSDYITALVPVHDVEQVDVERAQCGQSCEDRRV
jgi:hypothetical protein